MSPVTAADLVFLALVGDALGSTFEEETDCRSPSGSDFVDVRVHGRWFRLRPEPTDEPVSLREHRGEAT